MKPAHEIASEFVHAKYGADFKLFEQRQYVDGVVQFWHRTKDIMIEVKVVNGDIVGHSYNEMEYPEGDLIGFLP